MRGGEAEGVDRAVGVVVQCRGGRGGNRSAVGVAALGTHVDGWGFVVCGGGGRERYGEYEEYGRLRM